MQSVIELPFLDVDKGEGLPYGASPVEVPQASEPAKVEQSEDNSEKDLPAPADAGK